MEKICSSHGARRAFTLLEVALIVAIIGMMLMIIVGYLLAPKQKGPLPAIPEPTPFPFERFTPGPLPKAITPRPLEAVPSPAAPPITPTPESATPAPATPAATPAQTIDPSKPSSSLFR